CGGVTILRFAPGERRGTTDAIMRSRNEQLAHPPPLAIVKKLEDETLAPNIARRNSALAKHIFVTGGVVSSLGKGLTCASIGMLLERRGLRVRLQKFDPYINVDPGTMSPYQHGEVYVLDDGAETDLDLGHYERFTNAPLTKDCNYTTGKIYSSVIKKERK